MKKLAKIFASTLVLFLVIAFIGCKNSNAPEPDNNTENDIFAGTYTGSILIGTNWGNTTLYLTLTASSNSYTIKQWQTEEKTGNPLYTTPGTYSVSGTTVSGSGSGENEHTMTGTTTDGGVSWTLEMVLPSGNNAAGTITKQ